MAFQPHAQARQTHLLRSAGIGRIDQPGAGVDVSLQRALSGGDHLVWIHIKPYRIHMAFYLPHLPYLHSAEGDRKIAQGTPSEMFCN